MQPGVLPMDHQHAEGSHQRTQPSEPFADFKALLFSWHWGKYADDPKERIKGQIQNLIQTEISPMYITRCPAYVSNYVYINIHTL